MRTNDSSEGFSRWKLYFHLRFEFSLLVENWAMSIWPLIRSLKLLPPGSTSCKNKHKNPHILDWGGGFPVNFHPSTHSSIFYHLQHSGSLETTPAVSVWRWDDTSLHRVRQPSTLISTNILELVIGPLVHILGSDHTHRKSMRTRRKALGIKPTASLQIGQF